MASVAVKIKYVGPVESDVRNAPNAIPAIFAPINSYVDLTVYTAGLEGHYGKSIYATNVSGWGTLLGLLPIASAPILFAYFEQAVLAAGTDAPVVYVNYDEADNQSILWWNQMAPNFVGLGFIVNVGDKCYPEGEELPDQA